MMKFLSNVKKSIIAAVDLDSLNVLGFILLCSMIIVFLVKFYPAVSLAILLIGLFTPVIYFLFNWIRLLIEICSNEKNE